MIFRLDTDAGILLPISRLYIITGTEKDGLLYMLYRKWNTKSC